MFSVRFRRKLPTRPAAVFALPHSAATRFLTGRLIVGQAPERSDRHASTTECIHRRLCDAGAKAVRRAPAKPRRRRPSLNPLEYLRQSVPVRLHAADGYPSWPGLG